MKLNIIESELVSSFLTAYQHNHEVVVNVGPSCKIMK